MVLLRAARRPALICRPPGHEGVEWIQLSSRIKPRGHWFLLGAYSTRANVFCGLWHPRSTGTVVAFVCHLFCLVSFMQSKHCIMHYFVYVVQNSYSSASSESLPARRPAARLPQPASPADRCPGKSSVSGGVGSGVDGGAGGGQVRTVQ